MKLAIDIALARPADARAIALLSREVIEAGLAWAWTPGRVLRSMAQPDTNVIVAREAGLRHPVGFAIMSYGDGRDHSDAHLQLFAVVPARRRRGIGRALLDWLELTARTAGIQVIRLETRASSDDAQAFYRAHGYVEVNRLRGYYQGVEDAVRLAKDLA
ncbi:MAG: GNAT family N-acetyltransferase [Burkholderiaceae bacterium]|jgi:ribosomal-protein-alanine N-acetyltransferase|nr:GNAT family N-acetyltransferase [Burkholderiaceae bacterium]